MNINTISYLISEGFANIKKNVKTSAWSLGTITATMIIFGIFFIVSQNLNSIIQSFEEQQGIQVFFDDMDEEQTTYVEGQIKRIPGIDSAVFKSKEEILEGEKDSLGENGGLLEGWDGEHNPYHDSYVITLKELANTGEVIEELKLIPNVRKITYNDETIQTLIKIEKTVKIISIMVFILLTVISTFIIMNSIKLTLYARRREISIMKYVGATDGFIKAPFIIEGIIIGLAGALITMLLVYFIYGSMIGESAEKLSKFGIISYAEISGVLFWVYMVLGIGIGTVGSSLSIKKYLDV